MILGSCKTDEVDSFTYQNCINSRDIRSNNDVECRLAKVQVFFYNDKFCSYNLHIGSHVYDNNQVCL